MIQSLEDTAKRSVVRGPLLARGGGSGGVTQVGCFYPGIFRISLQAGWVQRSLVLPHVGPASGIQVPV